MDADMRPQEAALPHLVSAHDWKILTATTTPAVVRHLPHRDRSAELAAASWVVRVCHQLQSIPTVR